MGKILTRPYRVLRRPLEATVRDYRKNLQAKVPNNKAELLLEEVGDRHGMIPDHRGRSDAHPIEKIILSKANARTKIVTKKLVPTVVPPIEAMTHKHGQRPALSRHGSNQLSKISVPGLSDPLLRAVSLGMLPGSLAIAFLTFLACITLLGLLRFLMCCIGYRFQPNKLKGSSVFNSCLFR